MSLFRSTKARLARVGVLSAACLAGVFAPAAPPAAMADAPAAGMKTYTEAFKVMNDNQIKFDMVPVKGGTVKMKLPDKDGKMVEQDVTVKDLYVGKFEVTWDNYTPWRLLQDRPDLTEAQKKDYEAYARPSPPYGVPDHGWGTEGSPALHISYHSAKEYCKFLSAKTGKKYRLPTEAEWQYACMANTAGPKDAKELAKVAWYKDNADDKTHPCGTLAPNAFGLFDMLGNVGEWCVPADGEKEGAQGKNKKTGEPYLQGVLKGGSFASDDTDIINADGPCTTRDVYKNDWQKDDPQDPKSHWWLSNAAFAGFRVVCEP